MKKTYTKPYIAVESFQLDAAIASSCTSAGKLSLGYAVNTCTLSDDKGYLWPNLPYLGFACANEGNADIVYGGDGNDSPCYHGPIDVNATFMNS